jgi:serine/threonine protein kinase
MLTARPPFPDGTALDKIISHADRAPRPLTEIRDDVPEELVRIVDRLMAKKPEERFSSALDLAEALRPLSRFGKTRSTIAAGKEIERKQSSPVPADLGWKDHVWTVVGILVVMGIALGILTMVLKVAHK